MDNDTDTSPPWPLSGIAQRSSSPVGPELNQPSILQRRSVSPGPGPITPPANMGPMRRNTLVDLSAPRSTKDEPCHGCCSIFLTVLAYCLLILFFPISLLFTIKVVKEYERAVVFRIGRLTAGAAKGPGLFFVLPCIDSYRRVDLRVVSFDVPPQEILSKDSVTVSVDAVVYFRISNPIISVTNVNDAFYSTKLLAQTTLRNVLGMKNLADMLSEREAISHLIQAMLDDATDPWGVKVERVEVKDIRLPDQLMRSMAAEAEASRAARAKVIAAEGEKKASRALKEAADVVRSSPAALQLRYLQTLSSIAAEHNSTVIFPIPIDILKRLMTKEKEPHSDNETVKSPRSPISPKPTLGPFRMESKPLTKNITMTDARL